MASTSLLALHPDRCLVFVEAFVGDGDIDLVPTGPVVTLVATDEQDGSPFTVESEQHLISVLPVEPGRNSFMFEWRLALIVSTKGRPSLGPTSRSTLIAASKASASGCSSVIAQLSQAGWNSTDQGAATPIIILLSLDRGNGGLQRTIPQAVNPPELNDRRDNSRWQSPATW